MLAARGWTTQEIAEYLNISANTVKRHISEAMKKLRVENRKDLKNICCNRKNARGNARGHYPFWGSKWVMEILCFVPV